MGQHGCSLSHSNPEHVSAHCCWTGYDVARPKHRVPFGGPIVRASHSTICHQYSKALLRRCMMRRDPSEQWLPEVSYWVQPSS